MFLELTAKERNRRKRKEKEGSRRYRRGWWIEGMTAAVFGKRGNSLEGFHGGTRPRAAAQSIELSISRLAGSPDKVAHLSPPRFVSSPANVRPSLARTILNRFGDHRSSSMENFYSNHLSSLEEDRSRIVSTLSLRLVNPVRGFCREKLVSTSQNLQTRKNFLHLKKI